MPKISIIIPTYNRSALVVQTIESVLAQTYQDFEIIVSDDGSTDGTQQALARLFGNTIQYLCNPHSGLPAVARNAALDIARGDYIAFLDSDDLWLPEKLSLQARVLDEHPEIGLVCSNALMLRDDEMVEQELYLRAGQGKSGRVFLDLLEDNFIITSSVIARYDAIIQAEKFPEAKTLLAMEDYALWLRIALDWEVSYLEDSLAEYRDISATSIRWKQDLSGHWRGMIYILDSFRQTSLKDDFRRAINLRRGVYQQNLVAHLWKTQQYRHWISELFKLITEHSLFVLRWIIFEARQNTILFYRKLSLGNKD